MTTWRRSIAESHGASTSVIRRTIRLGYSSIRAIPSCNRATKRSIFASFVPPYRKILSEPVGIRALWQPEVKNCRHEHGRPPKFCRRPSFSVPSWIGGLLLLMSGLLPQAVVLPSSLPFPVLRHKGSALEREHNLAGLKYKPLKSVTKVGC